MALASVASTIAAIITGLVCRNSFACREFSAKQNRRDGQKSVPAVLWWQ